MWELSNAGLCPAEAPQGRDRFAMRIDYYSGNFWNDSKIEYGFSIYKYIKDIGKY